MQPASSGESASGDSFVERLLKVAVSIVVLVPVTVFLGYGGWIVLTPTAAIAGYDPETSDGDRLRDRLLAWPDRNRDVMRTNGRRSSRCGRDRRRSTDRAVTRSHTDRGHGR